MSIKFFVAAMITVSASFALADHMGPQGDKFYDEAAHFTNACQKSPCQAPYSMKVVYNQKSRLNKMEIEEVNVLKQIAFDQAQVWGDTILEGDFYSAGRTRLDEVKAFYRDERIVGFKIRYSEKAWDTGECAFDGTKASLKGCKLGRIIEESYVSTDFRTFFTDEDRQADFSLDLH
ncbi:MAG: hypothetical protein J7501_03470 [Bdellovibrio sp.]|nr:hypothetical protein [Bdellovibrio sp.]